MIATIQFIDVHRELKRRRRLFHGSVLLSGDKER